MDAFNNIAYVPLDRGKFEEFVKYSGRDEIYGYCKTPSIFDKIVLIAATAHKYYRYETCVYRTLTVHVCDIFNAL